MDGITTTLNSASGRSPQGSDNHRSSQLLWQWQAGVAALTDLLDRTGGHKGYILSGPTVTMERTHFSVVVLSPQSHGQRYLPSSPADHLTSNRLSSNLEIIDVPPKTPIIQIPFCLVFSQEVSVLLRFVPQEGLRFSFDPADLQDFWQGLEATLLPSRSHTLAPLTAWMASTGSGTGLGVPDYRWVSYFGQRLLYHSPSPTPVTTVKGTAPRSSPPSTDLDLLQALSHEIQTPLATIHTLTQLVLRQQNLPAKVHHYLQIIAQECSEQITRFRLLLRAADMIASNQGGCPTALSATSLEDILAMSVPRWQKQAARRHLTLTIHSPPSLPAVMSDPSHLDQVLTGLVEYFSQTLPPGSELHLEFSLAGSQLKLELRSPQPGKPAKLASLGKLLLLHPETGHLSLNFTAAKHLLEAVGAKLTVRGDRHRGEILTLYLPLGMD
ncbi:hypothetical protein L3556_09400 [Candidatus Synechococcus calcipolaris G9]|uniref:histidine kinase n=1 Tax=Candidatus Synechococcus calcipolaris G9 TaxID=1497997 RepID=A0ABT6EZY4_9SYNE|nr:histidine kinase dimerization/phospho-acceptor domain-containing protein [Candidatus Synechococcus calcipolaris]MDG2991140.1 hypothetical protein [Candidatus Synechococcus calcipolaris G9]